MRTIHVMHPDRPDMIRSFKNRRECAKYGVAYFLVDNGHATRPVATQVASTYEDRGIATHGEYTFAEQPQND